MSQPVSPKPCVHRFAYSKAEWRGDRPPPIRPFDGDAHLEILEPLLARGFAIGRTFLNFPIPPKQLRAHHGEPPVFDVDDSFLRRGHLLVAGRPLGDDQKHEPKVRFKPFHTSLESKLMSIVHRYLDPCARNVIRIKPHLAADLKPGFENRARILVYQTGAAAACYRECTRSDGRGKLRFTKNDWRTPAFFLYLGDVDELHGAGLVLAFGMGGTETYAWAHRLRTDFASLFDRPNFTMVEMSGLDRPERPTSIDFCESWSVDVVLQRFLD